MEGTFAEILTDIGIVVGAVVGVGTFISMVYWLFRKFNRIEFQTEKIPGIEEAIERIAVKQTDHEMKVWRFLMDRALAEALNKGLGTKNSPFIVNDEVRKYYVNLIGDLRTYYDSTGHKLTGEELFREISSIFGERLLKEVCLPLNLDAGSCVTVAVALAAEKIVDPTKEQTCQ